MKIVICEQLDIEEFLDLKFQQEHEVKAFDKIRFFDAKYYF